MKKQGLLLLGLLCGGLLSGPLFAEGASGLEEALRATLSFHPALKGKRAVVEAKGHVGDTARAQWYPTLSGQVAEKDNHTHPANLRARQPVWTFGRIDSAIAYADADLNAEDADLMRVRRQLMEQTAVAYARMQGMRDSLRIAEENVANLDRLYQQIQRREVGQLASVTDGRLALARLVQARIMKERMEGEMGVVQTELFSLTQVPVAINQGIPEALLRLPSVAEVETLAQERNPDVHLKNQRILMAQAEVERERAVAMPSVYLQADRTFSHSAGSNDTMVTLVLESAIENLGFAAIGKSKAAVARHQAGLEDLNTTRNELRRTANSLYRNRQLQQNMIGLLKQSVAELTETLASFQRQYEAGQKAWLDLLNVQRELTEQRQQLVQAENDWLIYTLKLASLIGMLDTLVEEPLHRWQH
ncbi:MAG: TolC family protein [Magnetococcales bacterium]|nr:TolC family protein [Magnetococcales bacterium]